MPTKPCAQLRSVEGIQYELVRKKVKQLIVIGEGLEKERIEVRLKG